MWIIENLHELANFSKLQITYMSSLHNNDNIITLVCVVRMPIIVVFSTLSFSYGFNCLNSYELQVMTMVGHWI